MRGAEGSTMRNFIVCTVHLNIVNVIKSRRLRLGNVARMEEGRCAFKILTGKPTERPGRRREDNIRMNLKEIGENTGNWDNSAQDNWKTLVNAEWNLLIPMELGILGAHFPLSEFNILLNVLHSNMAISAKPGGR